MSSDTRVLSAEKLRRPKFASTDEEFESVLHELRATESSLLATRAAQSAESVVRAGARAADCAWACSSYAFRRRKA